MSRKLRGYESFDAFKKFSSFPFKSYKVSEVTKVAHSFCFQFFQMSPKLRGYKSYGAISNFQKSSKLQGFRSYKGYAGILLTIFPYAPPPKVKSYEVSEVTRLRMFQYFNNFSGTQLQSYEVTRLRPKLPSNPSTYLATTANCILSYVNANYMITKYRNTDNEILRKTIHAALGIS